MKQNLAIFLVCSVCLFSCTGLSFGDGFDIVNSSSTWQDASLLNKDPGTDNAAADPNSLPPGIPSSLEGSELIINGTKFDDLNGDGLRSKDENGLPGWTIVLKTDSMNYLQTTTDDEGRYSFQNLLPGIYTVSEINAAGWNQTAPGGGSYTINLVDKDAINYDFGNHPGPVRSVPKAHPIMSRNAWLIHSQGVKRLSEAEEYNTADLKAQANVSFPASMSLLGHVPYIPDERDQGVCGNCWVWGCTVPVEIANYFQNNVSDRLSIQYFNSNYNGGTGSWACCGGWEGIFASFYNAQKKFIPWSNTNANYRDGNRQCGSSTGVPAGSISTTPSYPITSIQWHLIPTRGSGITQDQAINNIKAILNQNKAVTLGFYLPDFSPFFSYWSSNSGVWNPDLYCGQPDGAYPGGHEVTIVGYNDTSPTDHYWIVLNSWGTDNAHPDGTYKVDMHMNYGCTNSGYYSYDFGYFDVVFSTVNKAPNEPLAPSGPGNGTTGTSYIYVTSTTDPDGDHIRYTFDWGDGTIQSQTSLVNSGSNASASHVWNSGGIYQVRAYATDSKSASSEWSEALTVAINETPNTPPQMPLVPIGPNSGTTETAYSYITSATDPDGDRVLYIFDWGDGTTQSQTGLVDSGSSAGASHIWDAAGIYQISAFAIDSRGASSDWSDATEIVINEMPNRPPETPSAPTGPNSATIGTSYLYVTSATDPDGDHIIYTFDWGDGSAQSQTGSVNSGSNAYASHSWSAAGTYLVIAFASDSEGADSGWSDSSTVIVNEPPNSPPNIPSTPYGVASGKAGNAYSYATYVSDPNSDQVKCTFDWGDGTTSETDYVASGTQATGSHTWSSGGTYRVKVMATDSKDANSGWSAAKTVIIAGNSPPKTPAKPTGLSLGKIGTSYGFATYAADPDRDQVMYTFDWGDGTTYETSYVASGARASGSHTWNNGGSYSVKAMATDSNGANSGWSAVKTVIINAPPDSPQAPSGPDSGARGAYYTYTASANDPDGNKVKYTFDWGDGTISTTGLANSGALVGASHRWIRAKTYQVKAKATDSQGAISEWSNSLSVTIT
jgi:hypothetical protein